MKQTAPPMVISYLRFSSPEQLKGDSIRRQLAIGDAWAKRNNLTIADTFRDQGISAFRGKNVAEGNLSRLLALIDAGSIPKGSILLIEQLDRLSRNALLDALELFLSIIRRDIKIVTLMDGMEYDRESLNKGMHQLMYSLMQMSLAHEESAKKSARISHAWDGKRIKMKEKPLTRRLPAWLKVQDGKIVVDQDKAAIIRKIVKLALDGHGLHAITKKMNAITDGLARVGYFNRSYISKILHSRALFGEFQLHKSIHEGGRYKRVPLGEPVLGYYPPVITESEFYAVQKQLSSRRGIGGRQLQFINLFVGILFNGEDGSHIQINDKGLGRRYVSAAALDGRKGASAYVGFPVDVFERAVLIQLHDLILPHLAKDDSNDAKVEADAMEARITEVDRKIEQTQEAMLMGDGMNTTSVVTLLAKLDKQKRKMTEQLRVINAELAARATSGIGQARDRLAELVHYFRTGQDLMDNDQRTVMRSTVRQVIDRIEMTVTRDKRDYDAVIKIELRDGSSLALDLTARHVNRMLRNEKGHPITGGAEGPPQWKMAIGGQRWIVMANSDNTAVRVASMESAEHIDVPVLE